MKQTIKWSLCCSKRTRLLCGWILSSWLLLLLALSATGCKSRSALSGEISGTYSLVSVDGKPVPCTIEHDGHAVAIKSGTFLINADSTCSSRIAFETSSGKPASKEVNATFTQNGSKLTMRWKGAGVTTGTVAGDTFTMNNEGTVFAYRK